MAEFLTTHKTASQLEDLIINARKELVLISPYWQISEQFFLRLKQADERRVRIKLVYGKGELKKQEKEKLAGLSRLRLYYLENLHAKCYYNEYHMVITSMNMYEFSEKNNREMGVLIDAKTDNLLYAKAIAEAESFIQSAAEVSVREKSRLGDFNSYQEFTAFHQAKETKRNAPGYCIRCSTQIKYDPSRPYCGNCYDTWAKFENYDYIENVCHCCGNENETSMNKPQCAPCFRKTKNVN